MIISLLYLPFSTAVMGAPFQYQVFRGKDGDGVDWGWGKDEGAGRVGDELARGASRGTP